MTAIDGRVAAITGAGSGIGRALALALSRRGCALALCDIDGAGLAATAALVGGTRATTTLVDVADRVAVERWADATVGELGFVNLVFNNAGVALDGSVAATGYDDLHWLMSINFWGVVHGTKAFLPHLEASGAGHVVNISSVFGLLGIPSQSAYNAAKFAVRGFTEALRIELDQQDRGVTATTVHPGGIKTSIVRNARFVDRGVDRDEMVARFDKLARTTPERAATVILRAVEKNKRRVMVGADAHAFDVAARLPPGLSQRLIGRLFRDEIG